jgi:hypothetical protein
MLRFVKRAGFGFVFLACRLTGCDLRQATSRSKCGFFSARSLRATPQAVAIRWSIVTECPAYSASPNRAITDCVVPTFPATHQATSRALGFFFAIIKSLSAACRGRRVPCSQLRTALGLTFR